MIGLLGFGPALRDISARAAMYNGRNPNLLAERNMIAAIDIQSVLDELKIQARYFHPPGHSWECRIARNYLILELIDGACVLSIWSGIGDSGYAAEFKIPSAPRLKAMLELFLTYD